MIGTGSAKEAIYQRLALDTPGPGFCHFPTPRMVERDGIVSTLYNEAWFEQLTAEKQILEKKHGFSYHRWILPKGRANEALDCRVYAYAALAGLMLGIAPPLAAPPPPAPAPIVTAPAAAPDAAVVPAAPPTKAP
jgi:phage terminase large subunit GpA-like protein